MSYASSKQLKRLQCSFKLDCSGLEPNKFEASLTSKVDELFRFHGINNIEASVKEKAIKTVRQQVCVQRRGRHYIRLLDDEGMREGNLHSPPYQNYHSQVKDKSEWKNKCHIKQHQLLTDALRDTFEHVCEKYGILNVRSHEGFLFFGKRRLEALEVCNLIDLLTADIIKDLSKLKRENWNAGRPTVDFKKVFDLCEDILLDRYTAHQAANNDLIDEENYRVWKAHVMVMISFAALMTAAEMTRDEVKKDLVQKDPFIIILILIMRYPTVFIIFCLVVTFLSAVSH